MASLPVTIFKFAMSPYENWQKLAWAGVFLITLGVLLLNILARTFFRNRTLTRAIAWTPKSNPPVTEQAQAVGAQPQLLLRRLPGAEEHQPRHSRRSKVTAFIGPSGCGKSTLLRTFNRMYELYPEQRAEGEILLDGSNILTSKDDVSLIRAKIGMVFQKPTPFPMSIYDNIAFGVKLFEIAAARRDGRAGRVGAEEGGAVERGQGQAGPERLGPVGRPAAAPVHRPRHRDQARGAAARRAVLGARPDLDRQDRGADPRAEEPTTPS